MGLGGGGLRRREGGFLYIAGRRIPAATLDGAFATARAFFALPEGGS